MKNYLIGIFFVSFIIYFAGLNERVHPDQFFIPFSNILRQPDNITCGPTCATMLLKEYNKKVTFDEVKSKTRTVWFNYNNKDVGTTPPEFISKALTYYGLSNKIRTGKVSVLKHYISLNRPCIVLVRTGEYLWHYIIIRGYEGNDVSIIDPDEGTYNLSLDKFEGSWSWDSDMEGEECGNLVSVLLKRIDVCPYMFICADNPITH